ncbi:MAG: WecB/TagA/CpsF family glycosyltransferase [Pseudomonadota bacterium]
MDSRTVCRVIGVPVDAISVEEAASRAISWASSGESRFVVACNAHVSVTAFRHRDYWEALSRADLTVPDGAPVAWVMRKLGRKHQRRVAGQELMTETLRLAAASGLPVFFYGSTDPVLSRLSAELKKQFPNLQIAGCISPPYREQFDDVDHDAVEQIKASGARIVFVGLGCPKQEKWMALHKDSLPAVCFGVGAAFDFFSGDVKRAPKFLRDLGLEWAYRFLQEPRRLWRRYLVTNSVFIWAAMQQLFRARFRSANA